MAKVSQQVREATGAIYVDDSIKSHLLSETCQMWECITCGAVVTLLDDYLCTQCGTQHTPDFGEDGGS